MERRLAAIMVADIVGYSTLMEKAEEHTAERVDLCHELIREKVIALGGRVFNTAGDAWLAEFGSPINALRCAAEIGNALAGSEDTKGDPLRLRFGLHLADVVIRGADLVGDGVNVAARLQQAAEPKGSFRERFIADRLDVGSREPRSSAIRNLCRPRATVRRRAMVELE